MRMRREKERSGRPLSDESNAARGALLSLTNARRHLRVAGMLAEERLFGPASSHVILAQEELAKSYVLTLTSTGTDIPKEMRGQVLRTHDVRHSITFGVLYGAMIQAFRVRAALRVQQRHGIKDFPPELRDEFFSELKLELKTLDSRSRKKNPLIVLLELTAGANDLKERGLYVDFDGKRWTHPGRISQNRFDLVFEVTRRLVRELGGIIRMSHKIGFQVDDSLKELLESQFAKNQGSDPEQILVALTKVALQSG